MITRYIAKPGGWFIPGAEVRLIADCEWAGALMEGQRICESPSSEAGKAREARYLDEELCPWDEFEKVEVDEFEKVEVEVHEPNIK